MTSQLPQSSVAGSRPSQATTFLSRHAQQGALLEPFVGDASPRKYFRLGGRNLLLMEDLTDPVGFAAFLRLSDHLNGLGLSAPRVFAADPSSALALIEDFGDTTYATCLAAGHDEEVLYQLAVDALLHLHHNPAGKNVFQPVYDMDVHLTELTTFSEWFAPAVAPDLDIAAFNAAFLDIWRNTLAPVATRFDTLVLRDFHIDNLMLLEDRKGIARCGLLDFQDGILGPCEYDLLSLLQDARRDLSYGLESKLLDYYCTNAPSYLGTQQEIHHRYALLGAQRHARILGVFVRLCQRDGKPRYLSFIPRVLRQFQTALKDAGLTGISTYLDTALPDWDTKALTLNTTLSQQERNS